MIDHWTSAFETHIPLLDSHHKEFFRILRDLQQMVLTHCEQYSYDDLMYTMCEIRDYATYHFYEEEKLMKIYNYPEYDTHVLSHISFIEKINAIDYIVLKQNPLPIINEMQEYVQLYIMNHVLLMDTHFGQYVLLSSC